MKVIVWSAWVGLGLLAGCASESHRTTAVETIERREEAVNNTDKILQQTQETIADFSRKLTDLKREAAEAKGFNNKSAFESSIDSLQLTAQRTRLDLREQQVVNDREWNRFRARVDRAVVTPREQKPSE